MCGSEICNDETLNVPVIARDADMTGTEVFSSLNKSFSDVGLKETDNYPSLHIIAYRSMRCTSPTLPRSLPV